MMRATLLLLLCTGCGLYADGSLAIDIHVDAITPGVVPTSGATQLTIAGANFDEGVTVTFDGVPAVAVARTSDQLLTVVPPARPIGQAEVVVANPDGRALAVPAGVRYFASTIDFAPGTRFFAEPIESAPVFGDDLDGDGLGDAVVITRSGELVALHVDRDGRAKSGVRVGREEVWEALALVELDGDGRGDVVGPMGTLTDNLNAFTPYPAPWSSTATYAIAADFDGDGALEIVVVQTTGLALLERGGAGFLAGPSLTDADHHVRAGTFWDQPEPPVAADFDGDGKADLAYVATDGRLRVALGPDLVSVATLDAIALPDPVSPFNRGALAALDVDLDGRLDLVAAERDRTLVYRGGSGNLAAPLVWPALCPELESLAGITTPRGPSPEGLAVRCSATTRGYFANVTRFTPDFVLPMSGDDATTIVDLDRDGRMDLVHMTQGAVLARFNTGLGMTGHATLRIAYPNTSTARTLGLRVVAGHFRGGSIAVANGNTVAIVGDPTAPGVTVARTPLGEDRDAIDELTACDLDGDGFDDLVAMIAGPDTRQVRAISVGASGLQLGPSLVETSSFNTRLLAQAVPGGCEAILATMNGTRLQLPLEAFRFGAGGVVRRALEVVSPNPVQRFEDYQIVDLDGDGDLDLFAPITARPDTTVGASLLRRDGDRFVPQHAPLVPGITQTIFATENFALEPRGPGQTILWHYMANGLEFNVVVAELDGDGAPRVLATVPIPAAVAGFHARVVLGDVDGDGVGDAIVVPGRSSDSGERIAVITRPGGFGAQPSATLDLANHTGEEFGGWESAALVDVDGDGLADLVFAADSYDDRLGAVLNASR